LTDIDTIDGRRLTRHDDAAPFHRPDRR
jgi:hypothetical protein